ncbi:MAG TPA: helix-turn-helix transcriptional regulator, partial [Bacteroidales bacterium]|nr:helix-turn-helix transcriptional regulator [Bacteroidales bacterium]
LEFLKAENKSSAQFAEEIGVQPSGISHILSGRNNPSLDFVLKMLEKYKFLSTDWLLFGKGSMYKEQKMQTLFDESKIIDNEQEDKKNSIVQEPAKSVFKDTLSSEKRDEPSVYSKDIKPVIEKVVWFYTDKSFEEYFPSERKQ